MPVTEHIKICHDPYMRNMIHIYPYSYTTFTSDHQSQMEDEYDPYMIHISKAPFSAPWPTPGIRHVGECHPFCRQDDPASHGTGVEEKLPWRT